MIDKGNGDTRAGVPELNCDVVMKGGITSGVVFPRAIRRLAQTYRLRSIAGTSAGAIAAALAAAAEYGRLHGKDRFAELDEVPRDLGRKDPDTGKSCLLGFFQPAPETAGLFALALAAIGKRWPAAVGCVFRMALWPWLLLPLIAVLGVCLVGGGDAWQGLGLAFLIWLGTGVAIWLAAMIPSNAGRVMGIVVALVFAGLLVGHIVPANLHSWVAAQMVSLFLLGLFLLAGALLRVRRALLVEVPENLFGLCTGNTVDETKDGAKGLTPWLHERIQRLAGREQGDGSGQLGVPLTFHDLEGGEEAESVKLRIMTTSLTRGRPRLLPFRKDRRYFDPEEFKKLFPESVVQHLIDSAHAELADRLADGQRDAEQRKFTAKERNRFLAGWVLAHPRLPFPRNDLMPVIVAARMSLSFPVLLSAVPLWQFAFDRKDVRAAWGEWEKWVARPENDSVLRELLAGPQDAEDRTGLTVEGPEHVWFTDGGVSSNFPIHLFDNMIPKWPTFGINLRYYEEGQIEAGEEVTLAEDNNRGWAAAWARLSEESGSNGTLFEFLGRIFTTMQNWQDDTLTKVPGYRDRIAHVNLTGGQGGLNLDMPPDLIRDLGDYGCTAADRLAARFAATGAARPELSFDNHRWIRLRSALALFQDQVERMEDAWKHQEPGFGPYSTLVKRPDGQHPGSYEFQQKQRQAARVAIVGVRRMLRELESARHGPDSRFSRGAPNPEPQLRITPKL